MVVAKLITTGIPVLLSVAFCCVRGAPAQMDPASTVVDPEAGATAQSVMRAAPIAFDVVSIRRVTVASDRSSIESGADGDGITVRNLALKWIIDFAYGFERPDIVSGLSDWATTENYDIVAKVAANDVGTFQKLNQTQRRVMLQQVLQDRFQLRAHLAPKEMPVYAMVVRKNGSKLSSAKTGDPYKNGASYPNGNAAGPGTITPTPKGLVGQAAEIRQLVVLLSRLQLGRQVVDRTGLMGRYDFVLQFSPTAAMRPVINGQMQPLSPEDEALPSVFTAVQEQLGLRLEPAKAVVDGLIVDHVEHPSEN